MYENWARCTKTGQLRSFGKNGIILYIRRSSGQSFYILKLDVLVNNGARSQRSLVKKTPLEVDRALLDLNTVGTISLTKAILPHMIERREGQIVVVSSVLGKFGLPYAATYGASKHALQGYFDTARLELAEHNIGVQIILPGPVKSHISKYAFTEDINMLFKDSPHYMYKDGLVRMSTERCAKLIAVSMANNLDEVWISEHPVLLYVYINQYFPNLFRWISKKTMMKIVTENYMKPAAKNDH